MHHRIMVWLELAGAALKRSLDSDLYIEEKQNARDLVTQMDRQTEAFFINKIKENYPDHRILGEEGTTQRPVSVDGTIWVIDPIDGTMNFIKQKRHFGIMVGIFVDGLPQAGYIYNVMDDQIYYGIVGDGAYCNDQPLDPLVIGGLNDGLLCTNVMNIEANDRGLLDVINQSLGVRYYGASCLETLSVINGQAAAYISNGLKPWDYGAGYAICQAMGWQVTNLKGDTPNILESSSIIFAPPHIHQEILSLLRNL